MNEATRVTFDRIRAPAVVAASFVLGLAAVLGGAFEPGPRLVIAVLLAGVALIVPYCLAGTLRPAEACSLGFIAWGAGVAAVLGHSPLPAKETVVTWLAAWALWVVAKRASPGAGRQAMTVLAGVACVVAIGVWLEAAGSGWSRAGGLFFNPNVAAAVLVPTMAVVLIPGRERVWSTGGLVLVLASGLVLTGSRAGLVAVGVAAVSVLPGWRSRIVGAVAVVGAGAGLLLWRAAATGDALAWHRLAIWRAAGRLVASRPLTGVGPGGMPDAAGVIRIAHPEALAQHLHLITSAESTPLGILVQTGVIGLILFLAATVMWLVRAWPRGLVSNRAQRALVFSMVVFAAVHDLLRVDIVLWWWAMLAGLVVGADVPDRGEEPPGPEDRTGSPSRLRAANEAMPTLGLASQAGSLSAALKVAETEELQPRPSGAASHKTSRLSLRRGGPAGPLELLAGLGLAGLILWGVAQPSYARWRWAGDRAAVESALRAEPWLSTAARSRTRELLARNSWTWQTAAEATYWGRRATALRPGQARLWADLGRVHARVVRELDPWSFEHSVMEARSALAMASALEPHLPWYWAELAMLERDLGRLEQARALTLRALDAEPSFVRAWLLLARIELDLGRVGAAGEALHEAELSQAAARGLHLSGYERDLVWSPGWQWDQLRAALP